MPTGVYDRATCKQRGPYPESAKEKIRLANTGRKASEETKLKQSLAIKGTKKTAEDRAGISQRMMGNKHGLGHRHTEETKAVFRAKARRGPDSNFWKGGKTDEAKIIRSSSEYRLWRQAVYECDDYTCQICGQRGGRLQPDHIKRFSDYPELRLDVNNGRTLCEDCHKQTPNYGRRREQTPENDRSGQQQAA